MSFKSSTTQSLTILSLENITTNKDKYERIRTVGKGAFGTAVLYKRISDSHHIVLKEINMIELSVSERQMALNEVEVLSMLEHPHIISYLGSYEKDGMLVIEMEYADGGTLSQFISRLVNPLSEQEIVTLFAQIVRALDYMHEHNILHRDLKTANIFLTKDLQVKVGDFGISKVMSTKAQAQTVLGTPYYISPEMCEGKQYNQKSDIWALGCILYELACRDKAFQGPNLPTLVNKIMKGTYDPLPDIYSEKLASLVDSLLKKEPEKRPTCKDIMHRIEEINQELKQDNVTSSGLDRRSILFQMSGYGPLFSLVPISLPQQNKVLKFAVGNTHFIALTSDLTVYTWGEGKRGQLGCEPCPLWVEDPEPVETLNSHNVIMIGAGDGFSVFVSDSGMILTCGDGTFGCLGHGDTSNILKPKLIEKLLSVDVVDMSCGENHVGVLTGDGDIYIWGQLAPLGIVCLPTELEVPAKYRAKSITCGLDDRRNNIKQAFVGFGVNSSNKLGLDNFIFGIKKKVESASKLTLVKSLTKWKVKSVCFGKNHSLIISECGSVITMGNNAEFQLGHKSKKPSIVQQMSGHHVVIAACGPTYCVVGTETNAVYFWGTRFTQVYEKSSENSMASTGTLEAEVVKDPQKILMLYSSDGQISSGQVVTLNSMKGLWHCTILLVETTALLPNIEATKQDKLVTSSEKENCLEYDSLGPVPDWMQAELALSEEVWPGEFSTVK